MTPRSANHPTVRPVEASPAGAIRERAVPCRRCQRPTYNTSARCWCCIDEELDALRLDDLEAHDGEDVA